MPARIVRLATDDPELHRGFDRIRADFDVPPGFPPEVLAAADRAVGTPVSGDRRDLRDVPFLTIDPKGSRDLDQAYFAEKRGDGFRVLYAIADVAAFVAPDDVVDHEAHARGVTVYLPDRRAPLYPESIDEGAASLLPGQVRPALCWTIDLDADGAATTWHLERAIVRSRRAWTYAEAQRAIDDVSGPESLGLLRTIGRLRQAIERARGGVSLPLPSQDLGRRRGGYVLEYDSPRPSEGWNAQISLLAGLCAASTMVDAGVGILRTLPPPDDRSLGRLHRTATALGIAWPPATRYADLIPTLDPEKPAHEAFLQQAAGTLRGAGYAVIAGTPGPAPVHGAIAAPYAHVTAPLRRLADRYANEVLIALFDNDKPNDDLRAALVPLPGVMADASRRAAAVERGVVDLAEALVLRGREGAVFHAAVVDLDRVRDRERATVLVRDPAVIASIDGAGLALGDEIDIRLASVDPASRRVDLTRVV
jgi:exoribonuclease R